MKKKVLVCLILLVLVLCFAGCNRSFMDTTYKFDEAFIQLPDGDVVHGKVQNWTDFEDGDQLQVKIDGVTYLTHASNVVLISH